VLQFVEVDIAGTHDRGGVIVVDQGQQQVLERCEFVVSFVGDRQRLVQRFFEALGESRHKSSLLLHHALQRMLVLTGEIHDLRHFGLGHLKGVDAAFAHAVIVDMHHDLIRGVVVLLEKTLQHMHDKLHGSVVVIQISTR
jgi:hypothetical protein